MDQPNVLLVVLDAVRPDHLSTYGYGRETDPFLSSLAEESLVYENAFANSNWTPTSHAAMFTGRMPSQTGVYGDTLTIPESEVTLPQRLRETGYRTFGTAAGAHIRSDRGFGRGFDEFYETYRIMPSREFLTTAVTDPSAIKQSIYSITRGHDNYTYYKFDRLRKWIADEGRPFFVFLNLKTAHHRYNPPRPYKAKFSDVERPAFEFQEMLYERLGLKRQSVPGHDEDRLRQLSQQYPIVSGDFEPTETEADVVKSWYDGAIRYMDDRLSSFVEFLDRRGLLDNTVIIVTADHGEQFGEHGLEKHQYSLYEELLRVPLVVYTPDDRSGRVARMVSLLDLYPTILGLGNAAVEERPLALNLLDDEHTHDHLFAEVGAKSDDPIVRHYPDFQGTNQSGPIQSVRNDRWKLLRYWDGRQELYDWRDDPAEREDRRRDKNDVVQKLDSVMDNDLKEITDKEYGETVDDDRLRTTLEDLGYI